MTVSCGNNRRRRQTGGLRFLVLSLMVLGFRQDKGKFFLALPSADLYTKNVSKMVNLHPNRFTGRTLSSLFLA
jgi:hypothetical protein